MGTLQRHWNARRRYARPSDWLWSLYNRLLLRPLGRHLPLRGKTRDILLANQTEPLHLRLGTTDWLVMEEIFFNGEYDAVLAQITPPVKTIVDLGANVGLSLRLWRDHFPAVRVIAVEPDAGNLAMCRRNAGRGDQFQFVQACAAASRRTVYLQRTGGEWAASMRDAPLGAATEQIQTITVEELFDRLSPGGPIDLLKCDIEGAEREIFAACSAWITRVRCLVIELHGDYTPELFLADLQRNGGRFKTQTLVQEPGLALVLGRAE